MTPWSVTGIKGSCIRCPCQQVVVVDTTDHTSRISNSSDYRSDHRSSSRMAACPTMSVTRLLFCVLTAAALHQASGSEPCVRGEFRDATSGTCLPCSACQMNHVIRTPCTAFNDTICGPFYEFGFFQQAPDIGEGEAAPDAQSPPLTDLVDRPEDADKSDEADPEDKASAGLPPRDAAGGDASGLRHPAATPQEREPTVHSDAQRWKELCYGLIGALAAVTLLAVVYIIVTQIKARHGACKARSLSDAGSAVVCYHTELVSGEEGSDSRASTPPRACPHQPLMCVDPRGVVHLEAQLRHNSQGAGLGGGAGHPKGFLKRVFHPRAAGRWLGLGGLGSPASRASEEHLVGVTRGNDYVMDTFPAAKGSHHHPPHSSQQGALRSIPEAEPLRSPSYRLQMRDHVTESDSDHHVYMPAPIRPLPACSSQHGRHAPL